MNEKPWDVIVVGGSVAGLSAALVLSRARRRVLVIDSSLPRNRFAEHVHGVLGHDGREPAELIKMGAAEVQHYGGVMTRDTVTGLRIATGFVVETSSGEAFETRRVVVATGLSDVLPEVEGLAEQWGSGVVTCPYCHGYEVRDQRLGVFASGEMSVQKAQLVRQWSPKVTLLGAHSLRLDADQRKTLDARGVGVVDASPVRVISADGAVTGVELSDGSRVDLDAIFVSPTLTPNDQLLVDLGADRSERPHLGRWVTVEPSGRTSIAGAWAVGNVSDPMATIAVATSQGALAAGDINVDLVSSDVALAVAGLGR